MTSSLKNAIKEELPRKLTVEGALYSLIWKKQKKDRPEWAIKKLNSI